MASTNRVVIEIEDFISKVQAKACLWDQSEPNYFKRDYQRVAWMEIADETRAPVNELKKRWRGLRDTFGRELRKLCPEGDAADADAADADEALAARCGWRHFRRLLFLRGVVSGSRRPRKRPHPHPHSAQPRHVGDDRERDVASDQCSSRDSVTCDSEPRDTETCDLSDVEASSPAVLPAASVKQEEPAAGAGGSAESCSDAQFLASLAPFLQQVPRPRQLLVRARLLQVLLDEQNAHAHNYL